LVEPWRQDRFGLFLRERDATRGEQRYRQR
jgi:hypothetical protein